MHEKSDIIYKSEAKKNNKIMKLITHTHTKKIPFHEFFSKESFSALAAIENIIMERHRNVFQVLILERGRKRTERRAEEGVNGKAASLFYCCSLVLYSMTQ